MEMYVLKIYKRLTIDLLISHIMNINSIIIPNKIYTVARLIHNFIII